MYSALHKRISSRNFFLVFGLFVFVLVGLFMLRTFKEAGAATNISANANERWFWNNVTGWADFYITDTVTVTSQKLTGYASSSLGDVSLDCATTRIGNICAASDYKVTNDGSGNLSGWGWNDAYGWVSFDCANHSGCGQSNYRVRINASTGEFVGDGYGYAWNDAMGWISFNCANHAGCGASDYKVVTSWRSGSATGTLESTPFDTGVVSGMQLNSVIWQGNLPADTAVKFQFAKSNSSSGPWTFLGPDGTSNTYYSGNPGVSIKLDSRLHEGGRYFRYRIVLTSNVAQSATPRVDDVIVNWSP